MSTPTANVNDTASQSMQCFTILHVTDIHEANTLYPRLNAYLTSHGRQRQFDLIAVTGDQLNLFHPLEGHLPGGKDYLPADDSVRDAWSAVLFDGVAGTLRGGTRLGQVPVLWIPGNHDPIESFSRQDPDAWLAGKHKVPAGVVSAHEKLIRLAPGLVAVGIGGSVPAYWSEDAANGKQGQEVWPGCPWRSEEQLKKDSLQPHIIPLIQQAVDQGDQVVFLTHSGPASSATTLIRTDVTEPDPIWKHYHHVNSGSPAFLDVIRSPPVAKAGPATRPAIPLVLHGHSHWSRGVHRISASTVVNPGSFKDHAAGLIDLRRDESGEWKVGTVELIQF